jgi:hypothetical protein
MAALDGVDVLKNNIISFIAVRKQNTTAKTIIDFPGIGTSIHRGYLPPALAPVYSITSSARSRIDGGTAKPSVE